MNNLLKAKFRILTDEELKYFENELIQFLIVNGIYTDEWNKINRENPEKAMNLITIFSDQILQKVYENISYIEKRTDDACFVFKFTDELIELIFFQTANKLDLSTSENIHFVLKNHLSELTFFKSKKNYNKDKELEKHELLMKDAIPSSKDFWNTLQNLTNNLNN
jgi:5'-3' exonuclease